MLPNHKVWKRLPFIVPFTFSLKRLQPSLPPRRHRTLKIPTLTSMYLSRRTGTKFSDYSLAIETRFPFHCAGRRLSVKTRRASVHVSFLFRALLTRLPAFSCSLAGFDDSLRSMSKNHVLLFDGLMRLE